MRERRFDVAIAGAGPAGSTLALRLARAGFSVALVEPATFPRFKACGEFMSPECLPMLESLGLRASVRELGAREVRGMRLSGYGRRARGTYGPVGSVRAPFDHGYAVRRERFDALLLDAALRTGGVELIAGRATELLRDADGSIVGLRAARTAQEPIELRASFTVGADGLRSRVARCLGVREPTSWLDKLALSTRFDGVRFGDHAEVHFVERGYFACAPVDGGLITVNLVVDRARYLAARLTPLEFFERELDATPELADRLRVGRRVDPVRGVGPLAGRTRSQTFDGAALVGDACGYVDPITGEGMFFALRGAELLASDVIAALHARRFDRGALAGYRRGRRREIAPRAALATLLQHVLRRPPIARRVLGFLADNPRAMDLAVALTGDYVPFGELARPATWLAMLARPRRATEVA